MTTQNNTAFDKLFQDLTFHIRLNKAFHIWMAILTVSLFACLYAYYIQLSTGLGVTGMRDYVTWGIYISNFVFFVATSLIGMLLSAVLGMIGIKWITPITRIAEIIAVAFAAVAGLVIVSDMGRPDRLANVFICGRFQSPILWDVTVVTVYFLISLLLLYIPMIPDLAICIGKLNNRPGWLKKAYEIISLNWKDSPEQNAIIKKCVRVLLLLVIPTALSIHTVTSWLFAVNSRAGWDSTIFGPYFVSGAFVAGCAAVIILMFFFVKNYKLQDYITEKHFSNMGKLFVLMALIYLYFNINEFLVPGYKLKRADAVHLNDLFAGENAGLFWAIQLGGLIIPIILMLFRKMRKATPLMFIAIAVLVGSWLKRYIIVVPTMEHPFLPMQHVPMNFKTYTPTLIELAITAASFIMVIMIITVLSKLFPVIPIKEVAQEKGLLDENSSN
jgi:molybdopterin-containing oxidoreductase family membrane subunit